VRYYWSHPERDRDCLSGRIFSYTKDGATQQLPERVCNYKWEFYQNVNAEYRYDMYRNFNNDFQYSKVMTQPGSIIRSVNYATKIEIIHLPDDLPGDVVPDVVEPNFLRDLIAWINGLLESVLG
jgi:hypothetical protein